MRSLTLPRTPYNWVAIGGTFDRLHKGHKTLLRRAFELGRNVVIGLTTQDMVRHKPDWESISSYEDRETELRHWLDSQGYAGRYLIESLADPYGPAVTMRELDLIVVSEDTLARAKEINQLRRKKGFPLLHIAVVTMVEAEDHISISSTRIRAGLIDREGRLIYREVVVP